MLSSLSSNVDWFVGHAKFLGRCLLTLLLLGVPQEHDAREKVDKRHSNSKPKAVAIAEDINFEYRQTV